MCTHCTWVSVQRLSGGRDQALHLVGLDLPRGALFLTCAAGQRATASGSLSSDGVGAGTQASWYTDCHGGCYCLLASGVRVLLQKWSWHKLSLFLYHLCFVPRLTDVLVCPEGLPPAVRCCSCSNVSAAPNKPRVTVTRVTLRLFTAVCFLKPAQPTYFPGV